MPRGKRRTPAKKRRILDDVSSEESTNYSSDEADVVAIDDSDDDELDGSFVKEGALGVAKGSQESSETTSLSPPLVTQPPNIVGTPTRASKRQSASKNRAKVSLSPVAAPASLANLPKPHAETSEGHPDPNAAAALLDLSKANHNASAQMSRQQKQQQPENKQEATDKQSTRRKKVANRETKMKTRASSRTSPPDSEQTAEKSADSSSAGSQREATNEPTSRGMASMPNTEMPQPDMGPRNPSPDTATAAPKPGAESQTAVSQAPGSIVETKLGNKPALPVDSASCPQSEPRVSEAGKGEGKSSDGKRPQPGSSSTTEPPAKKVKSDKNSPPSSQQSAGKGKATTKKTTANGQATEEVAPSTNGKKQSGAAVSGKGKKQPAAAASNKKKKNTFQDQVLQKMLVSCKPFTLKTLAQEVGSTETAVKYLMLSLLDKQLVFKKEFTSSKGRTKELYWANQESTSKEMQALAPSMEEVQSVRTELAGWQKRDAALAKELADVNKVPSNDELELKIEAETSAAEALKKQVEEIRARIRASSDEQSKAKGRAGARRGVQLIRGCNPRQMKLRINAMRGEWKRRKEKCIDFVDQAADAMEKKLKDTMKLLDVETDEAVGVKMPPKYIL